MSSLPREFQENFLIDSMTNLPALPTKIITEKKSNKIIPVIFEQFEKLIPGKEFKKIMNVSDKWIRMHYKASLKISVTYLFEQFFFWEIFGRLTFSISKFSKGLIDNLFVI
jgi:hypothetical protein